MACGAHLGERKTSLFFHDFLFAAESASFGHLVAQFWPVLRPFAAFGATATFAKAGQK